MANTTNTPLNLPPDPQKTHRQVRLAWGLVVVGVACALLGGLIYGGSLLLNWIDDRVFTDAPGDVVVLDTGELVIAVSPAMKPTFDLLVEAFNAGAAKPKLPVRTVELAPEKMVLAGLEPAPGFQALAPDSSLWLHQLEQQWAAQVSDESETSVIPLAQRRTNTPVRYAVSPVVIVAWESVARELSWPYETVGWQHVLRKATQDPDFKWNHPSTNNASGLLATLAEFYAGAGLTRGLTEEAATDPATLEYVRAVESTARAKPSFWSVSGLRAAASWMPSSPRSRRSSPGTRANLQNAWSPSTPPRARCGPTIHWLCWSWTRSERHSAKPIKTSPPS